MKMIGKRKSSATSSWALGLLMAGGCGAESAAPNEGPAAIEAPFLFKDPSTSGPRLDVYDFDGQAAISVGGPIGTEARLAGITGTDSLEELYRAVHPDVAVVPHELVALGERLAPALAELRSRPRPVQAQTATIEKSQSAFNTAVCRSFKDGSFKYTPVECQWSDGIDQLVSFHNPNNIYAGDRTYGWNNNNRTAKMNWSKNAVTAYSITLPSYWWNWMSVGGGGPYYAYIFLSGGYTGELGLTHHSSSHTF
ncbi:MAG TPA: hypothetical protein VGF45_05035 [Polyangia bacterium]